MWYVFSIIPLRKSKKVMHFQRESGLNGGRKSFRTNRVPRKCGVPKACIHFGRCGYYYYSVVLTALHCKLVGIRIHRSAYLRHGCTQYCLLSELHTGCIHISYIRRRTQQRGLKSARKGIAGEKECSCQSESSNF